MLDYRGCSAVIVPMTANTSATDVERYKLSGFHDFVLAKPFSQQDLQV
jgi:CheY-like chemotaxis protein